MEIYKLKYYLTLLILFVAFNLYSQTGDLYSIYTINTTTDRTDYVTDLYFFDYNTGYVTAVYGSPEGASTQTFCKLYKTTNGGINWVKQWQYVFSDDNHTIQKLALSFSNLNTGYFIKQSAYKYFLNTTNGGINYNPFQLQSAFPDYIYEPVTSMNSGNELLLIRKLRGSIVKIFNNGNNYSTYNFGSEIELFHVEVSKASNVIYVCGRNQSKIGRAHV